MGSPTIFFDIGDTLVTAGKWNAGAKECLTRLRQANYPLGIISNTGKFSRAELTSLLPEDFDFGLFDPELVILSSEFGVEKPNPAIFHHAIGKAGSNPNICYFVGENSIEIEAAKCHGMHTFHVSVFPNDFDELHHLLVKHRFQSDVDDD